MVFNVKIWPMQGKKERKKKGKKAAVMHSACRQSGLQGQLYPTVVLETTNGAFINCKAMAVGGCKVCTRNDEQPTCCCSTEKE